MRHPNAGSAKRAARTEVARAAAVVTTASCTVGMIRSVAAPTSVTRAVVRTMAARTAAHAAARRGEEAAATAATAVEGIDHAGSAIAGAGTTSTPWEPTIDDVITMPIVGQARRGNVIGARAEAISATGRWQLNKAPCGHK